MHLTTGGRWIICWLNVQSKTTVIYAAGAIWSIFPSKIPIKTMAEAMAETDISQSLIWEASKGTRIEMRQILESLYVIAMKFTVER